ncbi:protein of unknown function [Agreia sp. COWG]|nr:protein of unknown function [Agreia sp. COWG]
MSPGQSEISSRANPAVDHTDSMSTSKLRIVQFVAPFFWIVSYLFYMVSDHFWPFLAATFVFLASSIAAGAMIRYRKNRPTIPETSSEDDVAGR